MPKMGFWRNKAFGGRFFLIIKNNCLLQGAEVSSVAFNAKICFFWAIKFNYQTFFLIFRCPRISRSDDCHFDIPDYLAHFDHLDHLDCLDHLDHLDHHDHLVNIDHLYYLDNLDNLDNLDFLDNLDGLCFKVCLLYWKQKCQVYRYPTRKHLGYRDPLDLIIKYKKNTFVMSRWVIFILLLREHPIKKMQLNYGILP